MLIKLSNLNANLALTLCYLNPALNNSAQRLKVLFVEWIMSLESVGKFTKSRIGESGNKDLCLNNNQINQFIVKS